jgi:hypothetical protein
MEWCGPKIVPIHTVDTRDRETWTATKEPDRVAHFVATLQAGGKLQPMVLVETPDGVHHIPDGHHRFLAYEQVGQDPVAYVGYVPTFQPGDPWYDMHAQQVSGASRLEDADLMAGLSDEERAWVEKDPSNPERPDNPPSFIEDESTWEKAKEAVMPYWDRYSAPYGAVMVVYKNMGGTTKSKS